MRILILGGDGMLGHQLLLSLQHQHEVKVTLRGHFPSNDTFNLYNGKNTYTNVAAEKFHLIADILADFKPDAIINAIGLIKQADQSKYIIPATETNILFPHYLEKLSKLAKARLIHMSTDCIFDGKTGNYSEDDPCSAMDYYGLTKYLGECHEAHCVTLRTSIIGLELKRKKSLIEWFLAQTGTIKGFQKAIYSGFTTLEISRIIDMVLTQQPNLSGVWHVASQPISKYKLLTMLADKLHRNDIVIEADNDFECYRNLNGERFAKQTGYQAPSWDIMLTELAQQINRQGQQ